MRLSLTETQTHTIHGHGIFIYIYLKKRQPNLGKYTSHMDGVGKIKTLNIQLKKNPVEAAESESIRSEA